MIVVGRETVINKYGLKFANGAQLSPPAGTCTDTDWVRLAAGHVVVTYLPTRLGDPSSQVVARVELVEAALTHALPIEKIPVHYYEHLAIERYGEPTYRDAFKPHETVKARPWLTLPDGQALYHDTDLLAAGLCNGTKCHEHPGWLAWCPAGVSATACSRPSGLPEDLTNSGYEPKYSGAGPSFDNLMHYEVPFYSRPLRDNPYMRGTAAYNDVAAENAWRERQNRSLAKESDDEWMAAPYQLDPAANGPERRLVEHFFKDSIDQQELDTPFVLFILEDLALYRKTFPTKVTVPTPVVTPSF